MRIVYTENLKSGMILATPIYDRNERLLLKDGNALSDKLIKLLGNKNVPYVFISDKISEGVTIHNILSKKIRTKLLENYEEFISNIYKKFPKHLKTDKDRLNFCIHEKLIRTLQIRDIRHLIEEVLCDIESVDKKYQYYSFYKHKKNFIEQSIEVTLISILIGRTFDYTRQELIQLGTSAFLCNIGLIFSKSFNSKLFTYDNHFDAEPQHTRNGYDFLRESKTLSAIEYLSTFEHHELSNGKGYPERKTSDQSIPVRERKEHVNQIFRFSEIISVSSNLIDLSAIGDFQSVLKELYLNINKNFNPYVLSSLKRVINPYPVSSTVCLKTRNGNKIDTGIVLENTLPSFIPTIKSLQNKIIPTEQVSTYDIIVI